MQQPPSEPSSAPELAVVVVIGRNEGQRMVQCVEAALQQAPGRVVYVDSGSVDGSPARARELGAVVLELDPSTPFTAARARNAGLATLREQFPEAQFAQFLDADCQMLPGWLGQGLAKLRGDARIAGVAGLLRERNPDDTPYNKLCDMEWQAQPGQSNAVGGNALFRIAALEDVGGYNPGLIAGEEPEMCVRLRQRGWKLWRLEAPMALHDAQMTRLSQWWKRAVRFGFAQAQVSQMHRASPQRIWARETRSTVVWALGPPLASATAIVLLAMSAGGWWWLLGLVPLLAYDLLALRILISRRRRGESLADAALYAVAAVLGKFPQFVGVMRYLGSGKRPPQIIEYKQTDASAIR